MLEAFAKELAASVEHEELEAEAATAEGLAAVNELRASILSSVSHDLRTPLAAIKASATSLLQDDVEWTREAERELLTTIDEETDRLNRLVGSLLDMSRLQAGALEVHEEVIVLDEVLAEAVASIGAGSSGVVLELPEDLPPVLGDEALLERAFANIIANAVTYSSGASRPRGRRAGAGRRRRARRRSRSRRPAGGAGQHLPAVPPARRHAGGARASASGSPSRRGSSRRWAVRSRRTTRREEA